MATFFLDFESGNDANDGTTFANRWKTFTSGATAARIAPGDVIRCMASPDPTSLGQSATWTQDSKTIALTSAVTANISDCETAWTASANVTATADTSTYKENTKSCKLAIASAFTTGKVAYFATGTLDLSAYQQVSFWFRTTVAVASGVLELRLCSDTAGGTAVNTIAVPAIAPANTWVPVTVDLTANLGASIASIALYANSDPGTPTINIDNILACKASGSADSLTLTSLIGKIWNLSWVASTTYAANDIRKPTQPNRNGFRYKVTAGGGGSSGSSEPTWPTHIGDTVADGALTWTCEGLEDTWYGIQSINGTTVKLDNGVATLGNAGRGYSRATETVTTYKRETIKTGISTASDWTSVQDSGTAAGGAITFSGGWNRTDMSTQTGETWLDNQCASSELINNNAKNFVDYINLNAVRANNLLTLDGSRGRVFNCHGNNFSARPFYFTGVRGEALGVIACNNDSAGVHADAAGSILLNRIECDGNSNQGVYAVSTKTEFVIQGGVWVCQNCGTYGAEITGHGTLSRPIYDLTTRGNTTGGVHPRDVSACLFNASIAEATEFAAYTGSTDKYLYSQRHDQTADNHLIVTDGGAIVSATDWRHTASGISWKFNPTSVIRDSTYPMWLSVAKIAIAANTSTTIGIWARRDSTNVKGQVCVAGGQAAGIPNDVTTAMEPSINTWTQYTLNVTPTENCVVEVLVRVWDGTGTTNSYWVDDVSVA